MSDIAASGGWEVEEFIGDDVVWTVAQGGGSNIESHLAFRLSLSHPRPSGIRVDSLDFTKVSLIAALG